RATSRAASSDTAGRARGATATRATWVVPRRTSTSLTSIQGAARTTTWRRAVCSAVVTVAPGPCPLIVASMIGALFTTASPAVGAVVDLDRIEVVAPRLIGMPGFRVEPDDVEIPDALQARMVDLKDARRIASTGGEEDLLQRRTTKRRHRRPGVREHVE